MVTGIPPNVNADEFLASKNNPVKKFAKKMKSCLGGGKGKEKSRSKIYRHRDELPLEINDAISSLTHFDTRRRCTVRNAINLPWIKGDDNDSKDSALLEQYPCMVHGNPVAYLQAQ